MRRNPFPDGGNRQEGRPLSAGPGSGFAGADLAGVGLETPMLINR
jgi:hypothetical protein